MMDRRFLGSTIALATGIFLFFASFVPAQNGVSEALFAGLLMIAGSMAYKSGKKRKLRMVRSTAIRKYSEIASIMLIFLLVLIRNNPIERILGSPADAVIPVWTTAAYLMMRWGRGSFKDDFEDKVRKMGES